MAEPSWLSLSEAADLLGVHFTTLRRWTDLGLVEHMRTPGGTRKYTRKAIEAFIERHHHDIPDNTTLDVFESQAVLNTRKELAAWNMGDQRWYHNLSEDRRLQMRASGNRLTALMFQYCSGVANNASCLAEGVRIAHEYGRFCRSMGMTLAECMRTFLFFRHTMLNTIHDPGTARPAREIGTQGLFQRINYFLDEFLVGVAEGYGHP